MRSEQETNRAIDLYADMVRRICMVHLKNQADTEDIFQTVFLKDLLSPTAFESPEHEKAWFIRVTVNACKDLLRSVFRSRTVSLEELSPQYAAGLTDDSREVWRAVLALPPKYRQVLYLRYYEDYEVHEIAALLGQSPALVSTHLARAKAKLRQQLGGNCYDGSP